MNMPPDDVRNWIAQNAASAVEMAFREGLIEKNVSFSLPSDWCITLRRRPEAPAATLDDDARDGLKFALDILRTYVELQPELEPIEKKARAWLDAQIAAAGANSPHSGRRMPASVRTTIAIALHRLDDGANPSVTEALEWLQDDYAAPAERWEPVEDLPRTRDAAGYGYDIWVQDGVLTLAEPDYDPTVGFVGYWYLRYRLPDDLRLCRRVDGVTL